MDISDEAARIWVCKEMIQALHENVLRVIMNIVYNLPIRQIPGCRG